jgi:hypothetical protein
MATKPVKAKKEIIVRVIEIRLGSEKLIYTKSLKYRGIKHAIDFGIKLSIKKIWLPDRKDGEKSKSGFWEYSKK